MKDGGIGGDASDPAIVRSGSPPGTVAERIRRLPGGRTVIPDYSDRVHAITHRAPNEMGDCQSIPTSGPQSILYAQNDPTHGMTIAASVTGKGNQLPPTPGYRFVFILGCEAAGTADIEMVNGQPVPVNSQPDHSLAQAFGVDAAGATDKAFLGFQTLVEIDQHNVDWCDAVLDALRGGATLSVALATANQNPGKPDGGDEGTGQPKPGLAWPVIYGDQNMTVFDGVYGGAFRGQWYTGENFFQPLWSADVAADIVQH